MTGNFEFADKTAFNTEVDTEYFTETFWPQIKGYLVTMMNSALEEFENGKRYPIHFYPYIS